jgi:hypothetical protein
MPKPTVESLSVECLIGLHANLTQILRDNGLILSDSQVQQEKIAGILQSLVQI